jgi:hypothetical protein
MSSTIATVMSTMPAQTQPQSALAEGFRGGELVLIIAGGILTIVVLAFFIFLFVRASRED